MDVGLGRIIQRKAHKVRSTSWTAAGYTLGSTKWFMVSHREHGARLTCRGFKDKETHRLDTYAGTAQRASHWIHCSDAAIKKWRILACDIANASLQGFTYQELVELTGESIREVNLGITPKDAEVLRWVPGLETFGEKAEVLNSGKPGAGLVDAPRTFSLKVQHVFTKLGMKMITVVEEVWVWHIHG